MTITRTFDTATSSLVDEIKKHHSRVFRRAYIRRRDATTFAWEASWQDITHDVKSWGAVGVQADTDRYASLLLSGTNLVVDNESGRYNLNTSPESLWSGFADQQHSLVKIECGFIHQYLGTDGIWRNQTYPSDPTVFIGIISGDINLSDRSEVTLPLKSSLEFLRTKTSYVPRAFEPSIETLLATLRDATSGGSYIYRPLFGDTTSGVAIGTVTPSGFFVAEPLRDKGETLWDFIELNMANFNCLLHPTYNGGWKLRTKAVTATSSFEFYGRSRGAVPNGTYGHTIKEVSFYGPKKTDYYSPVVFTYPFGANIFAHISNSAQIISYATTTVSNVYGARAIRLEHDANDPRQYVYFHTSTGATAAGQAVADGIRDYVGRVDEQIEFTTSLITHLNLLDRVEITFDSSGIEAESGLWDLNKWDTELVWDAGASGSISLTSEPFAIVSVKINLDNLETTFIARQLN